MSYNRHPSEKLCSFFLKKPWQGADPFKAKYIFIGLDANYAEDVEDKVPEIWDYLNDGPEFWRKTGYHHPFRLPQYSGSGRLYHENFAKIGFDRTEADHVSFVELLHVPTTGNSSLKAGDLDITHLQWLSDIETKGEWKYVFMPGQVNKLMREAGISFGIDSKPVRTDGFLNVLADEKNGKTIYQMYHFSCYGWQVKKLQAQIGQIRKLVEEEINRD